MHQPDTKPLLQTRDLSVAFGDRTVLHGVSLTLRPDEVLGIVGETGAGKSVLARALIGLLPGKGRISGGTVEVGGRDLRQMPAEELRRMRGGQVALIGTDAKSLLDPVRPVGAQVADVLRAHKGIGAAAATTKKTICVVPMELRARPARCGVPADADCDMMVSFP